MADGLQKADAPDLQRRLETCSVCELRNDDRCTVCGCYLERKPRGDPVLHHVRSTLHRYVQTAAQIVAVRRKPSGDDTRDASPDGSRPGRSNCDDTGKLKNEASDGWQIIRISRRLRSLPEKFNALADWAQGDILVVWEDATGRFHASLAFRREAFDRIGGGP